MSGRVHGMTSLLGVVLLSACMASIGNPSDNSGQGVSENSDPATDSANQQGNTSSHTGTAHSGTSSSADAGTPSGSGSGDAGTQSEPGDGDGSTGASGDAGSGGTATESCTAEQTVVAKIVLDNCGSCHSAGATNGGFGDADDLDAVVQQGLVLPGNPGGSKLYQEVSSGSMPPGGRPLSESDQAALEKWINCIFSRL